MSALQGNILAYYNLGECYYHGERAVKDLVQAVKWYRMAAELGHAAA